MIWLIMLGAMLLGSLLGALGANLLYNRWISRSKQDDSKLTDDDWNRLKEFGLNEKDIQAIRHDWQDVDDFIHDRERDAKDFWRIH